MGGTELADLTEMEVDCGWEHFTGKTSIVLQHKRHAVSGKWTCYLKDSKKQFTYSNKHNSYVQKTWQYFQEKSFSFYSTSTGCIPFNMWMNQPPFMTFCINVMPYEGIQTHTLQFPTTHNKNSERPFLRQQWL